LSGSNSRFVIGDRLQYGRLGVLERGQARRRLPVGPDYRPKSTRHVVRDFTEALAGPSASDHFDEVNEFSRSAHAFLPGISSA
jgi:hypothetical protein